CLESLTLGTVQVPASGVDSPEHRREPLRGGFGPRGVESELSVLISPERGKSLRPDECETRHAERVIVGIVGALGGQTRVDDREGALWLLVQQREYGAREPHLPLAEREHVAFRVGRCLTACRRDARDAIEKVQCTGDIPRPRARDG